MQYVLVGAKNLALSKHETSGRPARYQQEQFGVLVLPMARREGAFATRATLTSFLARIAGQKNAISTAGEAGLLAQHSLTSPRVPKIPALVSYLR